MLTISELTVVYPDGTKAVNNFNLKVGEGQNLALIGANGAGKTTFMLSLMGILPVSKGTVWADGILLEKKNLNKIRSKIGFVFQNPDDQLFLARVYDDVAFGPRNLGLCEKEVKERVTQALSALGALHLENRSSLRLSGGEKRLAAIAAVLSMNPSVLLFDEPTAFLDLKARRNLIALLKTMTHTKVIASHDLAFLEETCERTVLLKDGSVFAEGKTCDLIRNQELMEACGL